MTAAPPPASPAAGLARRSIFAGTLTAAALVAAAIELTAAPP